MSTGRRLSAFATSVLFAFTAPSAAALAGDWPEKTVRIFTGPTGTGGSIDTSARVLADELTKRWKQPVVVDNRPGADGIIAAQALLGARDGHALLFTTHSVFTVVPLLREPIPYDPRADFAPISLATEDFLCVSAAPSLPVKSLAELVALARKKPAELNHYAVPGVPYLAYLAFQKSAGINTTFVAYSNPTNAKSDLSEGRLHVAVMPFAEVVEMARAEKLKLLAVTNAQRTPAAADVPTVAESGYPSFTFGGLLGMFGPKDMPSHLRERIASDVRAILGEQTLKARLANFGLVARGTSPDEFAAILDTQHAKWAAVARDNDVKPQH